jgi:ABC-2 type transport system ATP-binding protein
MDIFKAEHVDKQYGNQYALQDVSISVPEGSVFGLLGPNGAGKTTLIRIINQITAPDTGHLEFLGRPLKSDDIYNIGYLPEERGLYKKMKVGEQALYLAQLKGLSKYDAIAKIKYWFEKFEIQSWWNKKIEELSKGMQQKIQFVTTIIHDPKLLIFDEPFSGFDPINTRLLKKEILRLRDQGATIIFSTHNMESVEELCDYITLINKAQVVLEGPVKEIQNTYKANIFEVQYRGNTSDVASSLNGKFELLENKTEQHEQIAIVKIPDDHSPNDLLQSLLPKVEILGLNEQIPNMNQIFIQAVDENKEAQNDSNKEQTNQK